MDIITINDKCCWRCGIDSEHLEKEGYKITRHHGIPQTLSPKKNVVIPICDKCHMDINETSIIQMIAFSHRIAKELEELKNKIPKSLQKVEGKLNALLQYVDVATTNTVGTQINRKKRSGDKA